MTSSPSGSHNGSHADPAPAHAHHHHHSHHRHRRDSIGYGIAAAVLGLFAWVCGAAAGLHCSLLELLYYTDDVYDDNNNNNNSITFITASSTMRIGYWSVENVKVFDEEDTPGIYSSQGRCTGWSKNEASAMFDAFWYFGKTAAILGVSIPVLVSVLVLFCYPRQQEQGNRIRFILWMMITMCVVVGALNLLLMIGAASDVCNDTLLLPNKGDDGYLEAIANGCELGPGAYLAIVSFVLWNCAGLSLYLHYQQQIERVAPQHAHHSRQHNDDEIQLQNGEMEVKQEDVTEVVIIDT